MAKLIVFHMERCPNCPLAKKVARKVAEELGLEYQEIDVEEDMITALQYSVASTPSIALEFDGKAEVLFRSEVPDEKELREAVEQLLGTQEA